MTRSASSVGRPFVVFSLALALVGTIPTPTFAAPPDPATTSEVPPDAVQPQPAAEPAPAPAPVYQPQPQPMPQPQPLPPAPPNRNRGLGLLVAGASVFTISYLISAVAGAFLIDSGEDDVGRPLLIPLAGPFIGAARTDSALAGLGLGFGGVAQIAGFGMMVGGGVWFARSRAQARVSLTPGGVQLRF